MTTLAGSPLARGEGIVLALILLVAAVLRFYRPDLAYFNLHVERDLYRALLLLRLEEIPLLGSEMQYGGRVFGPLIYFLYAIPLAFSLSPVGIGIFIALFNMVVLVACWLLARRFLGSTTALFATGLYAVFPLEIIQLRYLWNPCFLPGMVLGMYGCFVMFLCGGRRWWLVGTTLFFCAGLQLHFSMLMTLPALLVPMFLCRRFPGWRVGVASLAVIFISFLPMMIHEVRSFGGNLSEVVEAPEIHKSFLERHRPNPNAWRNLVQVVTIDFWEDPYRIGFSYYFFTQEKLREKLGGGLAWYLVAAGITGAGILLFTIWLLGVWLAGREVWRGGLTGIRGTDSWRPRLMLLLLLWQFTPVFFLTFMNFHTPVVGHDHSLVPIRYYLVTFPAGFLLAGIGFARLLEWARGLGSPLATPLLVGVPVVYILLVSNMISVAYFEVMRRTGTSLPYIYFRAPSLAVMLDIRDYLLDDLGITYEDYYHQVSTRNVFMPFAGEITLDYLITQDGRAMTNPGLGPTTHVLIHGQVFPGLEGMAPIPEEFKTYQLPGELGLTVEDLNPVYQTHHITIFTIELDSPDHHPYFEPDGKRNFYYTDRKMIHLGSERK